MLPLLLVALLSPICLCSSAEERYPALYRLPSTTAPTNYKIYFRIDVNNETAETFLSETSIHIVAKQSTNLIVLHANTNSINKISVTNTREELYEKHTLANDDTNFLKIYLRRNLTVDEEVDVFLSIDTNYGVLDGVYRSPYWDENNDKRWAVMTQFAPVSARKAFPCYDEPEFKTPFTLSIDAHKNYSVITNTKETNTSNSQITGYKITNFETTPKMPTYLVAFIVSGFSEKLITVNNRKFSVIGRTDVQSDLAYALDHGRLSLEKLESFLGVPYRLPKLGMVAVPDFLFNAMENWGIIMYKEELLMYNRDNTPTTLEQKITTLLCHENAHNWFGNELTPTWWSHVWLSEGFASYFENLITDEIKKEWLQMEQFVVNSMQETMQSDSLKFTNPMSSLVYTPSDAMANYNYVAYPKAASVIRMIDHALGREVFKDGLNRYLKKKPMGSVTPKDLFDSLQQAVESKDINILPPNITVGMIFSSWSDQASYPLIYAQRMNDSNAARIRQERYYHDKSLNSEEKWWVPLTIEIHENQKTTNQKHWINPNQEEISIDLNSQSDWFLVNVDQTGYYRVMYNEENWVAIHNALKTNHSMFSSINRAEILDDAFELAKSGRLSYAIALDLISYMENEDHYIPWVPAYRALNYIQAQSYYSKYPDRIMNLKRKLVTKLYDSVGFEYGTDDDLVKKLSRNIAISIGCGSALPDCNRNLEKVTLELFQSDSSTVHPDLRTMVYCNALHMGKITYSKLWQLFIDENRPSERTILLNSLACTFEVDFKENLLYESISEALKNQDRIPYVIAVIKSDYIGLEIALKFLRKHYLTLQKMSQSPNGMGKILEALANKINREEQMFDFLQLNEMYRLYYSASERMASERAIQIIYDNSRWRKEAIVEVDEWLLKNVNSGHIVQLSFIVNICSLVLLLISKYFI